MEDALEELCGRCYRSTSKKIDIRRKKKLLEEREDSSTNTSVKLSFSSIRLICGFID